MNLVGQKVNHTAFGPGKVTAVDDVGHITIEFEGKTSTFKYPDVFETFLSADDSSVQAEIAKDIQEKKAAIEAEKAARAKALEEAKQAEEAEKASKGRSSSEKKYVPVKREAGKALTYLVFQGGIFAEELKAQTIWAPIYTAAGKTVFYWDSLLNVREGDVILHCADGYIRAVSRAKGPCSDAERPDYFWANELTDPNMYREGRKVDLEYTVFKNPIKTADYKTEILEYCRVKYAPFDRDGNGNLGYLYDLDARLASVFLKAAVEKNEELKELDYIQFLL